MIKKTNLIFLLLLTLCFTANAGAALIDFRSFEFSIAEGEHSKTVGGFHEIGPPPGPFLQEMNAPCRRMLAQNVLILCIINSFIFVGRDPNGDEL